MELGQRGGSASRSVGVTGLHTRHSHLSEASSQHHGAYDATQRWIQELFHWQIKLYIYPKIGIIVISKSSYILTGKKNFEMP